MIRPASKLNLRLRLSTAGWPMGNTVIDFSRDDQYLNALGSRSKGYIATVSPAFYTRASHLPPVPPRLATQ